MVVGGIRVQLIDDTVDFAQTIILFALELLVTHCLLLDLAGCKAVPVMLCPGGSEPGAS